jgi:hypothetical protein
MEMLATKLAKNKLDLVGMQEDRIIVALSQ